MNEEMLLDQNRWQELDWNFRLRPANSPLYTLPGNPSTPFLLWLDPGLVAESRLSQPKSRTCGFETTGVSPTQDPAENLALWAPRLPPIVVFNYVRNNIAAGTLMLVTSTDRPVP